MLVLVGLDISNTSNTTYSINTHTLRFGLSLFTIMMITMMVTSTSIINHKRCTMSGASR